MKTANLNPDKAARKVEIAIVSAKAPQAGRGKYRNPVHVRVYDESIQPTAYARQGKGRNARLIAEWPNVDARNAGPRSAYGQAMQQAETLVASLTK